MFGELGAAGLCFVDVALLVKIPCLPVSGLCLAELGLLLRPGPAVGRGWSGVRRGACRPWPSCLAGGCDCRGSASCGRIMMASFCLRPNSRCKTRLASASGGRGSCPGNPGRGCGPCWYSRVFSLGGSISYSSLVRLTMLGLPISAANHRRVERRLSMVLRLIPCSDQAVSPASMCLGRVFFGAGS